MTQGKKCTNDRLTHFAGVARATCAANLLLCSGAASAGVDITGTVNELQVAPNGTLWFGLTAVGFANNGGAGMNVNTFCANSWMSLALYVPAGDPNYAYYYGLLVTSLSKGFPVWMGNISTFNGSTPCDVTKTGYGIVLMHP